LQAVVPAAIVEAVPLLTTPLSQVTYEHVIEFCRTFPEGVRVEYKREPANITKVISSFANTVGGVWVIGVDTDKTTNMPLLPAAGMKREPGIEERITQSAVTGVYPGITPAVRVFDIPGQDRVVVVVRVPESVEAPHAIQNATRVWIRNASTTEPYELADIDRIDYLLKRRGDSAAHRERLVDRAAKRSSCALLAHRVRVVVCPVFPRGALFSRDELFERAERLKALRVVHLQDFRLIHEAVSSPRTSRWTSREDFYFECGIDGVAFYEAAVKERGTIGNIRFVMLPELLLPLATTLGTAVAFLKDRLTNALIRYQLDGCQGMAFLPHPPSQLADAEGAAEALQCLDSQVTVEATTVADELVEGRSRILIQLLQDVLWAFNYRSLDTPTLVYETGKREGVL
jgi:Schlafen, AlbA_2